LNKFVTVFFMIGFVLLVNVSAYASDLCSTPQECNQRGTVLYSKGKYSQAIPYFLRQLDIAAGSHNDKQIQIALNNLALSYWKKGDKYFARAWVMVAQTCGLYPCENLDEATKVNANKILPAFNNEKRNQTISGTYRCYAGYGKWSTLQIKQINKTTFKAKFEIVRYGNVSSADDIGPAAYGCVVGFGKINGADLIFSYKSDIGNKSCNIHMEHKGLDIVIKEFKYDKGCEFGGYNLIWMVCTT